MVVRGDITERMCGRLRKRCARHDGRRRTRGERGLHGARHRRLGRDRLDLQHRDVAPPADVTDPDLEQQRRHHPRSTGDAERPTWGSPRPCRPHPSSPGAPSPTRSRSSTSGHRPSSGATVTDTPPATLTNVAWTCTATPPSSLFDAVRHRCDLDDGEHHRRWVDHVHSDRHRRSLGNGGALEHGHDHPGVGYDRSGPGEQQRDHAGSGDHPGRGPVDHQDRRTHGCDRRQHHHLHDRRVERRAVVRRRRDAWPIRCRRGSPTRRGRVSPTRRRTARRRPAAEVRTRPSTSAPAVLSRSP